MNKWKFVPDIMYVMKSIASSSFVENEKLSFRVSSLPYCPLYDIYSAFKSTRKKSYSESFYTSVGNAVHSAIQSHLFKIDPSIPFGNWICTNTLKSKSTNNLLQEAKCTYQLNKLSLKEALKQHKCPHGKSDCKKYLTYKELELEWKGLSGHVDTIFKIKGKIVLVDYKTTGMWLLNSPPKGPDAKYIEQIETYAYLIYKLFKIKVDIIAIVYIARDKSMSQKEMPLKIYAKTLNKKFFVTRKKITLNYIRLYNLRKKVGFPGNLKSEHLKEILDNRPCHSRSDYNRIMLKKFKASQTDCPMLSSCVRSNKAVVEHLKTI
jgi:hypothetical protein